MNLHISPTEVLALLLHRIQSAGLLRGFSSQQLTPASFPRPHDTLVPKSELGDELLSLVGHGWRHDCWAEPVVRVPIAWIIPCDLSGVFNWQWAGAQAAEFDLLPPAADIEPRGYLLRDIAVYHQWNLGTADSQIERGWRELNVLECAQVLAQSCAHYQATACDKGLGSLTTRTAGIPVDGESAPLRLHLLFGTGVQARIPLSNTGRQLFIGGPDLGEYNHHVAICRETIDLSGGRNVPLGTLRRRQK